MSHLFLMETLRAVHFGRAPSYSTTELQILLPSGNARFQDVYISLRQNKLNRPGLGDEDALLLLCAILSDSLVLLRAFEETTDTQQPFSFGLPHSLPPENFMPFSPTRETRRMNKDLLRALDTWYERFGAIVPRELVSLYFFCRLLLSYPDVLELPCRVGYKPTVAEVDMTTDGPRFPELQGFRISEDALKYSWLILEHVDSEKTTAHSPWLPIVLFYASLVVGLTLKSVPPEAAGQYGSLRSLSLFKNELQSMIWPCCADMIVAIQGIMT